MPAWIPSIESQTVARNYAEVLFELGEKSGNTDRYADLIDAVAAAVENTRRLQTVLMSPRVSKTEKARLFSAALPKVPPRVRAVHSGAGPAGPAGGPAGDREQYLELLDQKLDRVRAGRDPGAEAG